MLKELIPKYLATTGDACFLVGGAVRDLLCNRQPLDFDIVVPENPEFKASQLALATKGHLVKLGRDPYLLYRVVHPEGTIDITTIKGSCIESDLQQRDFTINAMAFDLSCQTLIDPLNGSVDLNRRVVRMTTQESFSQDPARLVRAHRMAAGLNFSIEPQTSQRISLQAALINDIAGERIWPELQSILLVPNSTIQMEAMKTNGLLAALFSETGWRRRDDGRHSLNTLANLEMIFSHPEAYLPGEAVDFIKALTEKECILSKMTLLLHDTHRTCPYVPGRTSSIDQDTNPGALEDDIITFCRRLRTSTRDRNWIAFVVGHHHLPMMAQRHPKQFSIGRFFKQCGVYAPFILIHYLAEILTVERFSPNGSIMIKEGCHKLIKNYFNKIETLLHQPPLIDGRELMDVMGLEPSPFIGGLMTFLEEARLEEKINSKPQAIKLAKGYLKAHL